VKPAPATFVEAVRHNARIVSQMKRLTTLRDDEIMKEAKELRRSSRSHSRNRKTGSSPFPIFPPEASPRPADAALVRKLGANDS